MVSSAWAETLLRGQKQCSGLTRSGCRLPSNLASRFAAPRLHRLQPDSPAASSHRGVPHSESSDRAASTQHAASEPAAEATHDPSPEGSRQLPAGVSGASTARSSRPSPAAGDSRHSAPPSHSARGADAADSQAASSRGAADKTPEQPAAEGRTPQEHQAPRLQHRAVGKGPPPEAEEHSSARSSDRAGQHSRPASAAAEQHREPAVTEQHVQELRRQLSRATARVRSCSARLLVPQHQLLY